MSAAWSWLHDPYSAIQHSICNGPMSNMDRSFAFKAAWVAKLRCQKPPLFNLGRDETVTGSMNLTMYLLVNTT